MSSKWVEGVDFELLPNGKVKCLHCQKELSGKPAIGPHLSKCVKPSGEAPPKPIEETQEFGLDEKQNLIVMLKKFGVRYSEAVASFLEPFGFEDLDTLDEALRLSQVDLGKRKLIVTRWAYHVQKPIPPNLMQRWSQPAMPMEYVQPPALQTQQPPPLTREDLHQILEERERAKAKEEEIKQLREEIEMLKRELSEGNPSKKSEVQALREELQKMRQDEILKRLERIESQVGPVTNIYGVISQSLKTIENLVATSPLRWYLATGSPYPYEKKEIEEGAKESVLPLFSRLDKKYVVETD